MEDPYRCDGKCQSCKYGSDLITRDWMDSNSRNPAVNGNFQYWAEIHLDGIDTIKKFISERGDDAMVAALVEGSIGYFTVDHADIDIADFKRGGMKSYCERADACFKLDRVAMYVHDIGVFNRCSPEKQSKLVELVKQLRKLDHMGQVSISMAYPTSFI